MKLKKMLLINWLYYEKTVLDFDDIVFLSGKTGEGKSALIDAMQIVILGKTDNSLFNKSANDKTTRDLMGYLRGKYKNGTFKREKGAFSSHLCMEFMDDKGQAYSFGIVFDCSGSTRNDMNYRFYMMNQPIPSHEFLEEDSLFGKGKQVYDIRRMKKYLDSFKDRSCRMFTTNMDYRSYFKQRMMIKDERFFDVFKMAVAYTPMMNISEFIVKNICNEEEDLDLEEMQEEIQDYRQMKEQLETVKEKKEQLSLIHEQYLDILKAQENVDTLKIEQVAAAYQGMLLEHDKVKNQYESATKHYQKLNIEISEAKAEYDRLEKNIEELNDMRKDNSAEILERKIQSATEKQEMLQRDVKFVQSQLKSKGIRIEEQLDILEDIEDEETIDLQDFDLSRKKLEVRTSINHSEKLATFDMDAYDNLKQELYEIQQKLNLSKNDLYRQQQEQQKRQEELLRTKQELEHGKKPYPKELLELKNELALQLKALHGKDISVTILADHITIKDESWRNAIEGYIRNQKLNIVVEDGYFMDAFRIYRSLKQRKELHTFSIIDQEKAKPRRQEDAVTLYDFVEVDQESLKPYVEYLLGRVVCCEEESHIRDYPVSITKDGMLYSGYAVSRINPKAYQIPFIGADSVEKQLKETMHQLKDHKEALDKTRFLYEAIKDVYLDLHINDDFLQQLEQGIQKAVDSKALEKEIEELRIAQTPESLQALMELNDKIKKLKAEKNKVYGIQVEQGSHKKELEKELEISNQRMLELEEQIKITPKPEDGIPETIASITSLDLMIQRKQQIDMTLRSLESTLEIHKVELKGKKEHYNDSFRISLNPAFGCDDYEREYEKHSENVVEDYIEKCRIAEEKAYECFQNNFFSAINSKIKNVKTQIDRLNRSIKRHQFGRSQYEFVCSANEDYREYYDLITNEELNGHNLLNTHVYEENEELIHELFDKISSLSSMSDPKLYQQLEKEVKMLSRFTTYLKFDILENGNSLRATIGSSSGGETQTPFYVAVLVSLFSVYDQSNGGLQLAIFDEAFDKMDNERIEECINLLKSLGFQAIIVTPTDKISNLSKSADMTLIAATDEIRGQRISNVQKWSQREVQHEFAQ